jgi:anti-anti-sigma factor
MGPPDAELAKSTPVASPHEKILTSLSIWMPLIRLKNKNDGEEGEIMLKVYTTKFGNVAVVCVEGRIVRGETDALRDAVLAQTDAGVIVLNLARVNTIDAGGLGVMLGLREHTQSRGIEFRLVHVTRLVRRILEITKLDTVFQISGSDQPDAATARKPETVLLMAACA